jgi:hypothetical protein
MLTARSASTPVVSRMFLPDESDDAPMRSKYGFLFSVSRTRCPAPSVGEQLPIKRPDKETEKRNPYFLGDYGLSHGNGQGIRVRELRQ